MLNQDELHALFAFGSELNPRIAREFDPLLMLIYPQVFFMQLIAHPMPIDFQFVRCKLNLDFFTGLNQAIHYHFIAQ